MINEIQEINDCIKNISEIIDVLINRIKILENKVKLLENTHFKNEDTQYYIPCSMCKEKMFFRPYGYNQLQCKKCGWIA
jgi:hypothetical protein